MNTPTSNRSTVHQPTPALRILVVAFVATLLAAIVPAHAGTAGVSSDLTRLIVRGAATIGDEAAAVLDAGGTVSDTSTSSTDPGWSDWVQHDGGGAAWGGKARGGTSWG